MNPDLERYRLECPQEVFYIPNFISEEEEKYLLQKIYDAPKPKWKILSNRRLQVWGGEIASQKTLIPQPLPPFLNEFPDIIGRLRDTGVFISSKHKEPNHVIINEYSPGQGIMPHEDGPSYHPVVCTISLGSHTVFNYYRYEDSDGLAESDKSTPLMEEKPSKGRSIDPRPIASVLLEPRSLIITRSSLYTDHLHGIEPLSEDIITPAVQEPMERSLSEPELVPPLLNYSRISDSVLREVATLGGTIERGTRVSLTCRDVERVVGSKLYRR